MAEVGVSTVTDWLEALVANKKPGPSVFCTAVSWIGSLRRATESARSEAVACAILLTQIGTLVAPNRQMVFQQPEEYDAQLDVEFVHRPCKRVLRRGLC